MARSTPIQAPNSRDLTNDRPDIMGKGLGASVGLESEWPLPPGAGGGGRKMEWTRAVGKTMLK